MQSRKDAPAPAHGLEPSPPVFIGSDKMFYVPLEKILTPEIEAELKRQNLRAVSVGIMVEPIGKVCTCTHRVCNGDTLENVASRYGVTLENLMKANTMDCPRPLSPGEIIEIP